MQGIGSGFADLLLSDAGRRRDICCQIVHVYIHLSDGQASQFLHPFSNVLTNLRRGVRNGCWPSNAQLDRKKRRIAIDLGFCLRHRLQIGRSQSETAAARYGAAHHPRRRCSSVRYLYCRTGRDLRDDVIADGDRAQFIATNWLPGEASRLHRRRHRRSTGEDVCRSIISHRSLSARPRNMDRSRSPLSSLAMR